MRIISGVRTVKRAFPHVTTAFALATGSGVAVCAPEERTAAVIKDKNNFLIPKIIRFYFIMLTAYPPPGAALSFSTVLAVTVRFVIVYALGLVR